MIGQYTPTVRRPTQKRKTGDNASGTFSYDNKPTLFVFDVKRASYTGGGPGVRSFFLCVFWYGRIRLFGSVWSYHVFLYTINESYTLRVKNRRQTLIRVNVMVIYTRSLSPKSYSFILLRFSKSHYRNICPLSSIPTYYPVPHFLFVLSFNFH